MSRPPLPATGPRSRTVNRAMLIALLRNAATCIAAGNFRGARAAHEGAGALLDAMPLGGSHIDDPTGQYQEALTEWLRAMPIHPAENWEVH